MPRRTQLLVRTSLSVLALIATGPILRADGPTPPPGYKVVYQDAGGKKVPIFVKDQLDPLRHANFGDDPLDHQKVFSETNAMANKTFLPADVSGMDKTADGSQQMFETKVYTTTGPTNVYNLGSKATFRTSSFAGSKTAPGFEQTFATKSASPQLDQAASAFAPIGSPDQDRTAPIDAKPYDTFTSPEQDMKFEGPEEKASHQHLKRLSNGQMLIEDIPDRPLTIDEVRDLINHGFKPNLSQPAAPASRPLNDPNYQPEPLRIDPAEADAPAGAPPASGPRKVEDDDANDPVPSPGTMADPPENAEPLPSK